MNISHNILSGIEQSPVVKLIVLIEVMKYAFISRHAFEYILREKKNNRRAHSYGSLKAGCNKICSTPPVSNNHPKQKFQYKNI